MKKLLVILMAAVMMFSVAAVSMAAATVEGDVRWEWTKEDGAANEDLKFAKHDLRFNFKGNVSDTVSFYLQYEFAKPEVKEYFLTMNQSWGKVQAGQWDHKLIPSRVIMKPHGINCVNGKDSANKSMAWLFDIPVGDAFTFGLWMIPDLTEDEMDYDLKFAYKADSFGAEVHYGVLENVEKANYQAFDVYYNVNDSIKVFVNAINVSDEYGATLKAPWNDNLAPVIGAVFKNIGGSKLTASLEMGLEDATDPRDGKEYAQLASQIKYAFNNKISLEVEYFNYNKIKIAGSDVENCNENKIVIRPRVKF